jgi:Zn-dependent protease/predicted transcriptional regulator
MKWSFRIARMFGIDVKIHITFFLVLLIGAMSGSRGGAVGMAMGVLFMLLLFVCVLLHEFGHSLVAQRFGIPVRQIVLLPIGGVAFMSRNPATAMQELLVAVAGPAVNVVIAAGLWLALGAPWPFWRSIDLESLLPGPGVALFLIALLRINIMLVLFNMIPAFPMDGGRVLRAILWQFQGFNRATRVAAAVGKVIAVIFVIVGLFGVPGVPESRNPFLVVIAFFIFMGAGAEVTESQARTVLATLRVGDAYNKHALDLAPDDRVSRVVDYLLTSYQPDFAVLSRGRLLGVVRREDVLQWLGTSAFDPPVTQIMRTEVLRVDHDLNLDQVRQAMAENAIRVAAVFEADLFLGLVSAEDIAEAHAVLSYMQRQQTPAAAPVAGGVFGGAPRPQ